MFYFIVIFFVIWLLLSWHFTAFFLILGILSTILTLCCVYYITAKKLNSRYSTEFSFISFILYFPYIIKEVIISVFALTKAILTNEVEPSIVKVKNNFSSISLSNIFANSVTYTPGTITLYVDDDNFTIHCFNKNFAESVTNIHGMYARIETIRSK